MKRWLPSPAMVVALIALLVALGGTATAAKQLTSADAAGDTGNERSLEAAAQLKAKSVRLKHLHPSVRKQLGVIGKLDFKVATVTDIPPGEDVGGIARCNRGDRVVGGGVSAPEGVVVSSSYPTERSSSRAGTQGWGAFVINATEQPVAIDVYAICAKAGKVTRTVG